MKILVIVDYVREMTVKKSCKYGEYGSFEDLLFLFTFSQSSQLIMMELFAKLRRTYHCGNVKSNCNFVFHNGERKEIT